MIGNKMRSRRSAVTDTKSKFGLVQKSEIFVFQAPALHLTQPAHSIYSFNGWCEYLLKERRLVVVEGKLVG